MPFRNVIVMSNELIYNRIPKILNLYTYNLSLKINPNFFPSKCLLIKVWNLIFQYILFIFRQLNNRSIKLNIRFFPSFQFFKRFPFNDSIKKYIHYMLKHIYFNLLHNNQKYYQFEIIRIIYFRHFDYLQFLFR